MKLFQIEEPEGGPLDPDASGAAIGIDASGAVAEIAVSVGGNAVVLADREGFEQVLSVPPRDDVAGWQELFERARLRAERALARPATHAVIVLAPAVSGDAGTATIATAADRAGMSVLRLVAATDLPSEAAAPLAAAMLAEDLAPRPEGEAA
ncbi:MAG TPA: hypothetical protein VL985_06005 [Stellaceae bacterium]|nr:hypothetical protein [Stellaceae bacterium]